jgi:cyanophycin synthetase
VCHNITPLDDPVTLAIAGKKPLVHALLSAKGIPVPTHLEFTIKEIDNAIDFMQRKGRACVVKPANGSSGRGVTTGITTKSDLVNAVCHAAAFGRELLIEAQSGGEIYRLLYLDGVLLDAIKRNPPHVVGDGKSTIRQLVDHANAQRVSDTKNVGEALLPIDLEMRITLRRQGLFLSSVPKEGQWVTLKRVVNGNAGGENESALRLIGPALIQDGASAAAALGIRLAGVDICANDVWNSLTTTGGVVLEVNTTPGYHYHYYQRERGCRVAVPILAALLGISDAAHTFTAPNARLSAAGSSNILHANTF